MKSTQSHPDLETLRAFKRGRLEATIAQTIASHLNDCAECRDRFTDNDESEDAGAELPKTGSAFPGQEQTLEPSNDQLWKSLEREITALERTGRAIDLESLVKRFPRMRDRLEKRITPRSDSGNDTAVGTVGNQPTELRPQSKDESRPASSLSPRLDLPGNRQELKPGNQFGKYMLLSVLGRGGMGVVFKARNEESGEVVALKTIARYTGTDNELVKRFRREATTSSRLDHPNIVRAVEAADVDGVPYLALELVPGTDLANLVRSAGPVDVPRALKYIRQAASGLGYAHDQGVVHRDVKPSNMLVHGETDEIKLLDLGLARVEAVLGEFTRASELTSTGAVFGTIDFMAPEQARDAKRADHRADIYSLGCTLHFLLTGKMVYAGETILQKLRMHREAPIPNLKEACPGIPLILDSAFRRMVAKEPEDRFASMPEVLTALDRVTAVMDDGAVDDTPGTISFYVASVSGSRPKAKQRVSRRTIQYSALAASVALLLGATGLLWNRSKGNAESATGATAAADDGEWLKESDNEVVAAALEPPFVWQWPENYPPPAVVPFDASQAKASQAAWAEKLATTPTVTNSIDMEFALIPPGEYHRGSAGDVFGYTQPGSYGADVEHYRPVTPVRLTFPIMLAKHEVTHGQFKAFVDETGYVTEAETSGRAQGFGTNGSWADTPGVNWKTLDNRSFDSQEPVTFVMWRDAQAFCGWLSRKEGVTYRLPTEAEWEFAARAGGAMRFGEVDQAVDLVDYVWADEGPHQAVEKRRSAPHPVGLKQPNAFGLHDMLGNVWELCHDSYVGDFYGRAPRTNPAYLGGPTCAVRGGSFIESYATTNPAIRTANSQPFGHTGFRVVRELPIPPDLNPLGEPLLVKDGDPISPRATVQSPPKISGLRSWSIELANSPVAIQSVAYSPQAKQIAVAGGQGESIIRIYDDKLNLVKLLVGSAGAIGYGAASGLAWSPDGKRLASTDWGDFRGRGLRIWDVETGAMIWHREGIADWTASVAWSADGKRLLAGGQSVYVVDVATGLCRFLAGNYGQFVWAPDGRRAVVHDNSNLMVLYDTFSLTREKTLSELKPECRPPFAWSPDGKTFITSSSTSGEALLFDGETLDFQKPIQLPFTPERIFWTNDSKRLLVGGNQTIVWDLAENKSVANINASGAIAWLESDKSVIIGRSDGLIEIRSTSGLPLARTPDRGRPRVGYSAIRPDGQEIALSQSTDLRFFESDSGKLITTFTGVIRNNATIAWSPSGDRLSTADDKVLKILDRQTGQVQTTCTGHAEPIYRHAWSADGQRIVTTSQDKTVRVWDTATGIELGQSAFNETPLDALWDHQGKSLAVALNQEVVLLTPDAKQTTSRHSLPARFANSDAGQHGLSWSPDGLALSCCCYMNPPVILDIAAGKIRPFHRRAPGYATNGVTTWSPSGEWFLSNSDYNESLLFNTATRSGVRWEYTHRPQWLGDSRRLLSEGFGSLELWGMDTQAGQRIGTAMTKLSNSEEPLVISADGHFRGPANAVLYVGQTNSGGQVTLTASQFEKQFDWTNVPEKASLLTLPEDDVPPPEKSPSRTVDDQVFDPLTSLTFASVELPADPSLSSGPSLSPAALVPRPSPIAGLQNWTIETAGHRGWIDQVAWSPTGKLIASGGEDGTIRIWDQQMLLQRVLCGDFNLVSGLDWSLDGRYLASQHECELRLWNVEQGRLLRTIDLPFLIHSISWSPDASRLAVGMDGRWCLVDAATGEIDEVHSPGQRLAWSPDGKRIALSSNMAFTIWDVENWRPEATWEVPQDVTGLSALAWSPDGKWIAGSFGPSYARVGIWDADAGSFVGDMDIPTSKTYRLRWSPDSRHLTNGYHVWDAATRKVLASLPGSHNRNDISPSATQFVTVAGNRVVIRDLHSGKSIAEGPETLNGLAASHIDLSSDNSTLVVNDSSGQGFFDATSGLIEDELFGNPSWQAIAVSPSADTIALKSEASLQLIYRDGRPTQSRVGHQDHISELSWSHDGTMLASGGRDGTLCIWRPGEEKPVHVFDHEKQWVCGIAWSADDSQIATIVAGEGPIRIWNAATGQLDREVGKLACDTQNELEWSSDGRSFVVSHLAGVARQFDTTSGDVQELPLRGGRVTWSGDGQQLHSTDSLPGGQHFPRKQLIDVYGDDSRLLMTAAGAVRAYSRNHHRWMGALIPTLPNGARVVIGPEGHYRVSPGIADHFVYVVNPQAGSQQVVSPDEFSVRFGWQNDPQRASFADLAPEPPPSPATPAIDYQLDRAAALATIEKQGRVRIRRTGSEQEIATAGQVPNTPFQVVGVFFFQQPVANEDLTFLRGLESLEVLSVWSCPNIGNGLLEAIGEHPQLRTLEVHWTKLTDEGLIGLTKFPRLQVLQLDGLAVSDQFAATLASLKRLNWLQMSSAELGDQTIQDLANLPALASLTLNCPKATDACAKDIRRMQALQGIYLNAPVGSEVLLALSELPHLSSLSLVAGKTEDTAVAELGPMRMLKSVTLQGKLSPETVAHLGKAPKLEYLRLNSCEISDAALREILTSKTLKRFESHEGLTLTGEGFAGIANSPVESLWLTNTSFTDAGLSHLWGSPELKELSINGASKIDGSGFANATETLAHLRLHGLNIHVDQAHHFARLKGLATLIGDEAILSTLAPSLVDLSSLANLEIISPKQLKPISQLKQVKYLYLYDASSLPAEEYQWLSAMSGLQQLRVYLGNMTEDHFANLAKFTGNCTLYLQGGQTTQTALENFKQQAPNWTVVLEGCKVD